MLLADGRPADALQVLDALADRVPHVVNPAFRQDRLLRCIAASRCGVDGREADAEAERLLAVARRWGAPGAVGEALLALGLVRGHDGVEELRAAVDALAGSPRCIEEADALLALAAALPAGAPEGVDALHRAHRIGTATGAGRIVRLVEEAVARDQLPRPRSGARSESRLTSTERRILELVEGGASVHEVGQALFLTPATVERHLAAARRGRLPRVAV
jgi:DNA-binding CsgD family transcriptional regulator